MAIIGASLAGSACAITLASQGVQVVVLDRIRFPRRKACGEGLSHLAGRLLARLGVQDELVKHSSQQLFGYRFALPQGFRPPDQTCVIRADSLRAWGISRATLDTAAIERLQRLQAATVLLEQPVKAITRNRDSWEVITDTTRVFANYVVLATGANPQAIGRSIVKETRPPSSRVGITWFGEFPQKTPLCEVCIIPFPHGEVYITALSGGTANLSAVGTSNFVQNLRDPARLRKVILDAMRLEVTVSGQSTGAAHFSAAHRSLDPRIYLVGDAYESFDPRCGLGMTHALMSGIAAGESILSALQGAQSSVQAQQRYEARHEKTARAIRRYSGAIGTFISTYQRYPEATVCAQRILGSLSLKLLDQLAPSFEVEKSNPFLAAC